MQSDVFSSLQLDGPASGREGRGGLYASIYLAVTRKKAIWGSKLGISYFTACKFEGCFPQFSWVGIEINKEESSVAYTLTL